MKKKIFSFMLMAALLVSGVTVLAACGGDNAIYAGKNLTLQEAVSQAEAGDLIKLDSNIVLDTQVNVDKEITIDLCGYTISGENIWNASTGEWSLISVQENGNLTIKNGTVEAAQDDCYAIDLRDGGKCTIVSGKYIGNVHAVYVKAGELEVKGGEFDIKQLSEVTHDSRYTLNCYDASYRNGTAKITVKGGKFANYNPAGSTSENPTAKFLADGYKVETSPADANGDVWYTVVAE